MTKDGDWLTPKVMGRLFLFKPPLLIWLSALSIRVFGLSLFAVRLPALVMGAAGAAALFAWAARARSLAAGVLAAGILVLSPFWQTFSRLCYTDVLASSFTALALVGVAFDPQIDNLRTRIAFGGLGAASVLTKSVTGALPFVVLLLYCLASPREHRPRSASIVEVMLTAAVILAPWHIYQAVVHPQWFWADYVQVQLLGVGLRSDGNGMFDRFILYYLRRLVEMDPVLAALAVAGLAGAWPVVRSRRRPAALLAICWTAVTVVALCAFQAKNLPYLVLLLPPLCILGAMCGPGLLDRRGAITACAVAVIFLTKAAANGQPWSLRPAAPPLDGAKAMRAYYDLHREAELIAVEPDDQFYSATIPLPHVRYCFLDPSGWVPRFAPHYVPLGISLTAEQFAALPTLLPQFEERLRNWGLNSPEPIGTAITIHAPSELAVIVRARPESDFYLPSAWLAVAGDTERTHQLVRYSTGRAFLLSRVARQRTQPLPAIPTRW